MNDRRDSSLWHLAGSSVVMLWIFFKMAIVLRLQIANININKKICSSRVVVTVNCVHHTSQRIRLERQLKIQWRCYGYLLVALVNYWIEQINHRMRYALPHWFEFSLIWCRLKMELYNFRPCSSVCCIPWCYLLPIQFRNYLCIVCDSIVILCSNELRS